MKAHWGAAVGPQAAELTAGHPEPQVSRRRCCTNTPAFR